MTTQQLTKQIRIKKSFLCIGLDTDINKLPKILLDAEDPVFEFNKAIIDNTHYLAVSYKLNTAFYEANGVPGWISLKKTIDYIKQHYPEIFVIADAKRGDIGNTSTMYAKAFFETLNCDSVTVAPYMGRDSVEPFLAFADKHTIMLALTSNEGASDFQTTEVQDGQLYEKVIKTSLKWKGASRLMYVVGATRPDYFAAIRKIIPDHFLLVPGVGAQGGSLEDVCRYGLNDAVGLLINSSRAIIYASQESDFAERANEEAAKIQEEMKVILSRL